jgi:hypothetical protein
LARARVAYVNAYCGPGAQRKGRPRRLTALITRLRDWWRGGRQCLKVDVEQQLLLVPLLLVLLSDPEDLAQHVDIEVLAFRVSLDVFLVFREILISSSTCSMRTTKARS